MSEPLGHTQRFEDLVDGALDGRLSEAERDELAGILESSAEARRHYVEAVALDELISLEVEDRQPRAELALVESYPLVPAKEPRWLTQPPRGLLARFGWITTGAAAAVAVGAVAISVGLVPLSWRGDDDIDWKADITQKPLAFVEATQDAVWEPSSSRYLEDIGGFVPGQRIRLKSGLAALGLENGIRLVLEGPVDIEVTSKNNVKQHGGRFVATVPPAAGKFVVVTADENLSPVSKIEATELPAEIGFARNPGSASTPEQPGYPGDTVVFAYEGSYRCANRDMMKAREWKDAQGGFGWRVNPAGVAPTSEQSHTFVRDFPVEGFIPPARSFRKVIHEKDDVLEQNGLSQTHEEDITALVKTLGEGPLSVFFAFHYGASLRFTSVELRKDGKTISQDVHPALISRDQKHENRIYTLDTGKVDDEASYELRWVNHSESELNTVFSAIAFREGKPARQDFFDHWNTHRNIPGIAFNPAPMVFLPNGTVHFDRDPEIPSGNHPYENRSWFFRDGSVFILNADGTVFDELRMMGRDHLRSVKRDTTGFGRKTPLFSDKPKQG